jgi:hypothetical protein
MTPKKILTIFALAALCAFAALPAAAADPYDYSYVRVVRLSLVEGDVQVARPDQQGWETAVVNLPIQQGYTVATNNGRAEIEFESGATARLAENSMLEFTELAQADGNRITRLTLTQGTATFYANLASEDSFVVSTTDLKASILSNARFRMDVMGSIAAVSVLKGEVQVDSRAGTNRVSKGHRLTFDANDAEQVHIGRALDPDEWDRWVADRDEVIHTATYAKQNYVSSSYYSSGYSSGLSDLYSYGGWYPVSGYGQCWRPNGVAYNWSPYSWGRWTFLPAFGWSWVSFEPWGWAPYHFGSWFFAPGLGWVWRPGQFTRWQPALVTWVRVGNQVGWVPQSPRDRPGRAPANLEQGLLFASRDGIVHTKMLQSSPADPNDKPQVLAQPPAGLSMAPPRVMTNGFHGGAPTGRAVGTDSHPGVVPAIVFDPRERKFVNNPNEPRGRDPHADDARRQTESAPAAPPFAQHPPAAQSATVPPAAQTPQVPRMGVGMRPPDPASPVRVQQGLVRQFTPPPRVTLPPPAPRANPAPPMRVEQPRPASPPPPPARVEAPRSSPPSPPPASHPPAGGGHQRP